jgi:hypothetical protein
MNTHPTDTLPPEAVAALARGHKIDAIRIVREEHGVDLKAAKDRVEAYARAHPALGDRHSPGEVRASRGPALAIALALAALLGWWLLSD